MYVTPFNTEMIVTCCTFHVDPSTSKHWSESKSPAKCQEAEKTPSSTDQIPQELYSVSIEKTIIEA
jgi:hypothetical protein